MPWDNNNDGWKGGPWGNDPEGKKPQGGKRPRQKGVSDFDDFFKKGQDRLKTVFPPKGRYNGNGNGGGDIGFQPPGKLLILFGVLIALVFIGYNFFTFRVQPNELGVVLRFGEYDRQAAPGLHLRYPYPVETVYTPAVTSENRVPVGVRAEDVRSASTRDVPEESLMLTGDENIVDVDFTVVWDIKNAPNYLFNIRDPEGTVKAVAESAMREVVGRSEIQPILTQARQITEAAVEDVMQQTLDSYEAGINIKRVQLLKVDPPSQVIDAFRDVQAARANNERTQNEAQAYANRVIPEARGEAARILEEANAYRDQVVAEAQGQADRFSKIYGEYRKAPEVTRQRLYLETMEDVFAGSDKIIIDDSSGQGVVPYLPLDQLNRTNRGQGQ